MDVREVLQRDAIPSVDDPAYGTDYAGAPDDDVIVLAGDEPTAYPVRFLHYHEIVNATHDGRPVAVTWCPLCGSAVVYDRTVDGQVLEFGVSGKLADDDLVMYDRETDSEWKQSLGECVAGPHEGHRLTVLPAAMTTYERFTAEYPAGRVLQPPGGRSEAASDTDEPAAIDYYDVEPYERYFSTAGFGLDAHRGSGSDSDSGGREWDRDDVAPKTVVLGMVVNDEALGVPFLAVESAGGVVQLEVGGERVVVFATSDGIHGYVDPGYRFEPVAAGQDGQAGAVDRFRADGTTWEGSTGRAADGRALERVPARRLFAFAWQDDHGPDAFWTPDQRQP